MIANLRTLGKFLDPQILPGERSGTFRDSAYLDNCLSSKLITRDFTAPLGLKNGDKAPREKEGEAGFSWDCEGDLFLWESDEERERREREVAKVLSWTGKDDILLMDSKEERERKEREVERDLSWPLEGDLMFIESEEERERKEREVEKVLS